MQTMIDIVVINFNTQSLLLNCLQSIHAYTESPYHLIVVDNGSSDGSVESARALKWPNLTVIANETNGGYAKACNQGIRAGNSPYIILLNSDILAMKNWLQPLLDCMHGDDKIAVVGPKLVDLQGRITGAGIVGTNAHHEPRGLLEYDEPGKYMLQEDCISVCGAAYMIRRDLLSILGLFDENYFFYFEETDYSFQARSHGYRVVYCPQSRMYHLLGKSCHNHTVLRAYFEASEKYFQQKWNWYM